MESKEQSSEAVEAVILAGGLGTRLRDVIAEDTPKCMAPVVGKPFLYYLLQYVAQQGIHRVVLSLGHKSEAVTSWLYGQALPLEIDWVIEKEPLGTGGGIQLALQACKTNHVAIMNGDTMFNIDLKGMLQAHIRNGAETSIALKALRNFERYGIVEKNGVGVITAFQEKAPRLEGLINGGVYWIDRPGFLNRSLPQKFSFEKEYLEHFINEQRFYGFEDTGYFIDIGVPLDYERAQADFQSLFSQA